MGKRKKVTSDFRLREVKHAKKEDRISELPNEILVHVLSFLTIEDAARTSLLSKSWNGLWLDLWMYAAELDFESAKLWEGIKERINDQVQPYYRGLLASKRQKYVKWVNQVVQSHRGIVLDVLRIRFDLDKSFKNDIDKWLQYAFARRVQKLELNLLPYGSHCSPGDDTCYEFPHELLGVSDAGNNNYGAADACFGGFKSFLSLRCLTFECVNVCGDVLQFLLHNCPFLEHLSVVNSENLEKLEVCGPSLGLKHLEIIHCRKLLLLSVCDTNIVSLKVSDGERLVLKNVPKLVDVFVGAVMPRGGDLVQSAISSWLSCCLSKLEVLTLRLLDCQLRMGGPRELELPQLTALKQLTFNLYGPEDFGLISYFDYLLRASPNLEKFVVKTHRLRRTRSSSFWAHFLSYPERPLVAFPLQHLRDVEMCGYCGHKAEVELVKYLLDKAAVVLERILIDPRNQDGTHMDGPGPRNNPEDEASFRNLAKRQLVGLVPSHVQLLFL